MFITLADQLDTIIRQRFANEDSDILKKLRNLKNDPKTDNLKQFGENINQEL